MFEFADLMIEEVENDGKHGVFKIGPLPKGYGHTLANPLRRVLLSSLPGGGVTSMRIAGVEHEYSTLKGVKETVVEILMNVKNIRFSCESDEPQTLSLSKKGEGDVTAGDLSLTENVQVMDPDAKIATITDKSTKLEMELVVERGIGYHVADEDLRSEVGRLPLDTDFSPVERVTFAIDRTRKGEQTDLDQITLTIFTDGSIDPKTALGRSARVLHSTFDRMMTLCEVEAPTTEAAVPAAVEEKESTVKDEVNSWVVEDLAISNRAKSSLLDAGIKTVGEITENSAKELLEVSGFGEAALKEVRELLKEYDLSLKED